MSFTPEQAASLAELEDHIIRQRLSFAQGSDERREQRLNKRHVQAQIEASVHPSALLPTIANLSEHERKHYSIVNLLRAEGTELTLEKEISLSIAKDLRRVPEHGGHYLPLRISATGLDTKTNSAGKYLTQTTVSGDILDALINQSRCLQLGAKFLTGLKYSQSIPTESSVHAGSWVAENPGSEVSASDPTFGDRLVTPHALASTTSISRQLLAQSSANLEQWLRGRIARCHALAIDAAAINGSGSSNQPTGLLKTANIGDVAVGQNGGAVTAAHILSVEAAVATANADSPSCAWLTTVAQRQKLRTVLELTSGGLPIWRDGGMLDYPGFVSNQVPSTLVKGTSSDCAAVIFGDWSQLLVAEFSGAIEVVQDVYSLKKQGQIELASWAEYDTLALQPAAFCAIQDAR